MSFKLSEAGWHVTIATLKDHRLVRRESWNSDRIPPFGEGWASREVFRQRIDQALPTGQLLMELDLRPIGERTDEADQIGREEILFVGGHRRDLLPSNAPLSRLPL